MERFGEIGQALATVDSVTTNLRSGTFTVSKDNVLAAAKIIQTQAEALADKLNVALDDLRVVPPGTDDVSTRIAPAWNDILLDKPDSYRNRIQDYINGLRNLAQQCSDSAKAYGYTDEQVAAAFGVQSA
jgi:PE family